MKAALSLTIALFTLITSIAFGSTLNCKVTVSQGEGDGIIEEQTVPVSTEYMVMADISLKPMNGYTLSGSLRADRVTIYAEGNGVRLAATGQNLAELNMGQADFKKGFDVNCSVK